jgi:hypothetical protein
MHFKLAFSHASSGIFRVNAFHVSADEGKADPFIAIEYADEEVFLNLLNEANPDPTEHALLSGAIYSRIGSP